jgi:predicted short-subunit dehydrogenase-like oxidoreductase (DUF2520 family)
MIAYLYIGCDTIKAGFIGAGKVGCSMAEYFRYRSIEVSGFYIGTHTDNTMARFKIFGSLKELINESDVIFLTVTDRAIAEVWSGLTNYDIKGKVICHCSGSLSSELFINADKYGACVASIHPILAFEGTSTQIQDISKAYFTIEGGEVAVKALSRLVELCKNPYCIIDGKNKIKYHCAACFASNFVVALCDKAVQLMSECGFEREAALAALTPLITANVKNVCEKGTEGALTGPIERGDQATVKAHLTVLNDKDKALYAALANTLTEVAQRKHKDRDYSGISEELLL